MNVKRLILSAFMGMLAISCNVESFEEEVPQVKDIPVVVNVELSGLSTKAGHEGALASGSLGLFYSTVDDAAEKYNAINREVSYIASLWEISGSPLFYKVGSTVKYLAYYPYSSSVGEEYDYIWTVPADQTKEASVKDADLLFSQSVTSQSEQINIQFKHALSKFKIEVLSDGDSKFEISDVTVKNCATGGTFNLMQNEWIVSKDVQDIAMYQVDSQVYECIVVPQSMILEVVLTGEEAGSVRTYIYKAEESIEFVGGNEYTLPLTLGHQSISMGNITLNGWTDVNGSELLTD